MGKIAVKVVTSQSEVAGGMLDAAALRQLGPDLQRVGIEVAASNVSGGLLPMTQGEFNTAVGGVLNAATFIAPLTTSIVPTRGTGPATYSRASVATVVDQEGLIRAALSGEARFYGARRVYNRLLATEAIDGGSWTKTNTTAVGGVADPAGGNTAFTITATASAGVCTCSVAPAVGISIRGTWWVRARNVTGTLNFYTGQDATTRVARQTTITSAWQRIDFGTVTTTLGSVLFGVQIVNNGDSIDVWHPQYEEVTGQANQNPSEYVSVGVLATPYHGAGVDGVKYFDTANGNTVASNVVTQFRGDEIASATLRGFWREAAGTQLVTPTAAIRDMTNAAWVKTNVTAAKTSTGADGTPSGATRCTASAANGTVIQTLVAAATSRTYSCYIKRVTGTGNIELTQDGSTFTNIAGSLNSSTYTRVQLNATQLNATFGVRIVTNGDAIDVDFNQFEAGAYATSPMATTGAARVADSLTYPGSNVNTAQGWAYAEVRLPVNFPAASGATFIASDAATSGKPLVKVAGQALTTVGVFDGATATTKTGLSDITAQIVKVASSWSGTAQAVTGGGATPQTGVFDGSMGDVSTMTIGSTGSGTEPTNGTEKNVRIGTFTVTDTELAGITA